MKVWAREMKPGLKGVLYPLHVASFAPGRGEGRRRGTGKKEEGEAGRRGDNVITSSTAASSQSVPLMEKCGFRREMKMKQKQLSCWRLAEQTLSRRPHAAPGWSGRLQSPSPPSFFCSPIFASLLSALFSHPLVSLATPSSSALPLVALAAVSFTPPGPPSGCLSRADNTPSSVSAPTSPYLEPR